MEMSSGKAMLPLAPEQYRWTDLWVSCIACSASSYYPEVQLVGHLWTHDPRNYPSTSVEALGALKKSRKKYVQLL